MLKKTFDFIYFLRVNENFQSFKAPDVVLHLNDSVEESFPAMVLADVLVVARSSYSYVAGILSDGIVYYIPFSHPLCRIGLGWKDSKGE